MSKNKNIIIGLLIIVLLIVLWPIIHFYIKYVIMGQVNLKISEIENAKIEKMNRDENSEILRSYIKDKYGKISELMSIKKVDNAGINSWYVISLPFRNDFSITIDTNKKYVFNDDFYDTLIRDPKFNHLYSEWVKKKIGCEDDNIELEFDLARDKHNSVHKKISIDFTSIVDVSNIEEEICRNTKNYMLYSIDKKKLDKNNKSNFLDEAKKIKENFYNDIISNNCQDILWENINIKLYYYDVDLAFDRYNNSLVNSNEDNFYYVRFGLKDNTIKYISDTFDCMYSGLILSNWFTQVE